MASKASPSLFDIKRLALAFQKLFALVAKISDFLIFLIIKVQVVRNLL